MTARIHTFAGRYIPPTTMAEAEELTMIEPMKFSDSTDALKALNEATANPTPVKYGIVWNNPDGFLMYSVDREHWGSVTIQARAYRLDSAIQVMIREVGIGGALDGDHDDEDYAPPPLWEDVAIYPYDDLPAKPGETSD